jgi:hypothetical protein
VSFTEDGDKDFFNNILLSYDDAGKLLSDFFRALLPVVLQRLSSLAGANRFHRWPWYPVSFQLIS